MLNGKLAAQWNVRKIFMKPAIIALFLLLSAYAYAGEKDSETFYAEFSAPCGRSVLTISGDKKSVVDIDPIGVNPIDLLRYQELIQTKFEITGYFTGKISRSAFSDCVSYPEFYITSYKPTSIGRRVDVESLDPEMHAYITQYPTDKFVPEDFKDGPLPSYIEEYSYTQNRKNSDQVEVVDFYGIKWFGTLKKHK